VRSFSGRRAVLTETGFVMFAVLIALVVVASIGMLLITESAMQVDRTGRESDAREADYLARAAMEHALWQDSALACRGNFSIGSTPFGAHSYTATTTGGGTTTTYTLNADQDAWIRNDDPDRNNSSGTQHIRYESGNTEQALYRFDLSALPSGARVLSASAWFFVSSGQSHPEGPVTAHRITADWLEADVTWNSFSSSFESLPFGMIPPQPTGGVRVSLNLTAQVQAWVNGDPNYGILLASRSEGTHVQYESSESGTTERPYLEVVVGSAPATPVNIQATGTHDSGVTRSLSRTVMPRQASSSTVLQLGMDPGIDAMLDSFYSSRNYGDHELEVKLGGGSTIENSLLQFELSAIPPGSRIIAAQLDLYHFSTTGTPADPGIDVHRVTRSWVEGTGAGSNSGDGASWDTWDGSGNWTSAGGDYEAKPVASSKVSAAIDDWESWEIGELVQGWVDGRYPNFGLILKGTGVVDFSFASKEHADPSRRPRLTITYACECGTVCLPPKGSGTVLMAVVNPTTLVPADAWKKALFESWGYTVSVISESANQSSYDTAIAASDAVFISETVNSNTLGSKLDDAAIGVVSQDGDYNSDLGFASGSGWTVSPELIVTEPGHYITQVFASGPLEIYSGGMEQLTVSGIQATGLTTLAATGGVGSLVALEQGATMSSGASAAGRRVMLPFGRESNLSWQYLNANGLLLLQRAIAWAAGAGITPPSRSVLMVVVDPVNLTAQEAAKQVLMESWGFTVNRIDESASQAEFDAAVATADVAYVAEDILSGNLGTKLREAPIGVVIEEQKLPSEFGIASTDTVFTETFIQITDNTHYITEPFSLGTVAFVGAAQPVGGPSGTLAPGLTMLAQRPSSSTGMLTLIETGGLLYGGGTAAGRRVKLPWGDNDFDVNALTADGRTIMRRAIEWGADAETPALSTELLFVVADPASLTAYEAAKKALIESWGYAVNLIDDAATPADYVVAFGSNDVIYISGEASDSAIGSKLIKATLGIVNEQIALHDELLLSTSAGSNDFTDIMVIDSSHYITEDTELGWHGIASSNQPLNSLQGTLAPGLNNLAEVWISGANYEYGLAVVDTGGQLNGGETAAGRRAQLPWGTAGFDFGALNANGQNLMRRAIEWARGAGGCASTTSLLFVVGDATTPSAQEAARQSLVESWCFAVTRLDEGASQAEYDAAAAATSVVYISSEADHNQVGKKLNATTTGIVNEDPGLHNVFGFSTVRYLSSTNAALSTDPSHYITEPFGGSAVILYSSAQPSGGAVGTLAAGLVSAGNWSSGALSPLNGLLTLETGAPVTGGGTAAGRRVQMPWDGVEGGPVTDINALTADGQTLLERSLAWAAGTGGGGGGGPSLQGNPPVFESHTQAQAGSDTTQIDLSEPSGTTAGDLLIAAVATDGNEGSSLSAPAGWTSFSVGEDSSGRVTFGVWWKIAGSSEPTPQTFSWSGNEEAFGWMMRFTGHDPTSPIIPGDDTGGVLTGNSSNPVTQRITTSENDVLVLRLGGFDDDDITVGVPGLVGHTPITMGKSGTGTRSASGGAGYLIQSTPGTADMANFALTSSEEFRTVTLGIRPAPAATN
jgi:type II secretory pathway pseudopilin PulG